MRYEDSSENSSWEKLNKKLNKASKKPKKRGGQDVNKLLSYIPESYQGNEDFFDDLNEEFEESCD
jgi:hypothetical protein